jgi:hypothetical protein
MATGKLIPAYGCPRCDLRWGGLNTCHCTACHITFSCQRASDKHRQGLHTKKRYCVPPGTVGLVLTPRSYPCWGYPDRVDEEE